ncbi:MAG: type VI secretion system protein TssA [Gemmatimonadota bacterium]|jgi:type VI secretion system protein ImpA
MPLDVQELLQPIPGDNPGGSDIRYEPVFDRIKQARVEEDDLPAGDWERERKTADWPLVIKLSTEVLAKQSKDLQVAAWLTEGLLKRDGLAGLRTGLDLLSALLVDFWDTLHPEIEEEDDIEFRAAPLAWVAQYVEAPVRLVPVNGSGHTLFDFRDAQSIGHEEDADTDETIEARKAAISEGKVVGEEWDEAFEATGKPWYKQLVSDIDAAVAAVTKLESVANEKFGDFAPRFAPLRDALLEVRQIATQLLAIKLELDPDPIEADPVPELAYEAEAGSDGGGTVSLVPRTRADAEVRIAAAARFLRAEKRTDPAPYLLLRGYRWGELRVEADRVEPKLLVAPPTELRSKLRGMLLDGRWADLLEAGEDVMATPYGRGWLDLQRYELTACSNLGSDFDAVANVLRGALQSLLTDVPQLTSLVLMDDTPTANAETQGWLRELALAPAGGDDAVPAPATASRGGGRPPFERAMDRVRAGEPERGIEMLIQMASQERSARDRFMRRSEAASIMVDTGREAVALPILEQLAQDIATHSLDAWESGDTIARTLGLLYKCKRRIEGDSAETQELYLRICRLDPLQAIRIDGQPQPAAEQ